MARRNRPGPPLVPAPVSVVLVTAPDEAVAEKLARTLVEERLIACANLVPKIRSIYRWEGKVHDEAEVLLVMKTRAEGFEALAARVKALHPYSVPEILQVPVQAGHQPYLDWVLAETAPEPSVVRRFHLSPTSALGALRQALGALGGANEPIRIKVDLNEYQHGQITRFPDGSGFCVMDERTDVASSDSVEVEVWGKGAAAAEALEKRVLEVALTVGVKLV